MSLAVIDYLEMYNVLCDRRNVPKIPLLQSILSICIEKKMFPEMLLLPGGHSEMRMRRLTDDDIDIILLAQEESDFIRVLDVSFNEIGDRGAEAIARWLKKVVTASQLNLASNNIGAQGAQYISEALHFNKSIKLLDVSGNNIEDDGGLHIAAMLQINTTLTHLRLVNNYLGVRALIALCTALRKNTTLKYLDISGNSSHIDTQTATTHEDISRHLKKMIMENTGIETLILGKLGFRDSTVQEYLSTAIQHCSLTTLDLRSNRIMRDGATALAKALWNHRTLENLSLAHNQIQDEGCIAISQMMKENDKLRKLDITHNNIHGPALRQLANCIEYANRTLRRLKVWGNHFDQGACESYDKLRSENSSGRFKPGSIDVTFYRVEDTWFCAKDENYSEELL